MDKQQCTICDKPISGIDVFGPLQWPLCWACFGEHEQNVIDIIHSPDALGRSKYHSQIKQEIHMLGSAEWREEFEEIKKIKARIEMLEHDIEDLEWELGLAKRDLWKLQKKVPA